MDLNRAFSQDTASDFITRSIFLQYSHTAHVQYINRLMYFVFFNDACTCSPYVYFQPKPTSWQTRKRCCTTPSIMVSFFVLSVCLFASDVFAEFGGVRRKTPEGGEVDALHDQHAGTKYSTCFNHFIPILIVGVGKKGAY